MFQNCTRKAIPINFDDSTPVVYTYLVVLCACILWYSLQYKVHVVYELVYILIIVLTSQNSDIYLFLFCVVS